jgi:hypothetical protein
LNRTLLAEIFNVNNGLEYPDVPLLLPPECALLIQPNDKFSSVNEMPKGEVILRWVNHFLSNDLEPIDEIDPEYLVRSQALRFC